MRLTMLGDVYCMRYRSRAFTSISTWAQMGSIRAHLKIYSDTSETERDYLGCIQKWASSVGVILLVAGLNQ